LREQPAGLVERPDRLQRRAGAREFGEQVLDRAADLLVGVLDDLPVLVVDVPDRQRMA
jgi:hypothetical protein